MARAMLWRALVVSSQQSNLLFSIDTQVVTLVTAGKKMSAEDG